MPPNFPFLLAASNALLKPYGRLRWKGAASERRKVFVAAYRRFEDRQAYISASRPASSAIAKAEARQTTCSSLLPKSNPKSVHSLLCSIAGSPSSSPSSPNFPNCSAPRKSVSVYAAYLRSTFLFPSQRPCVPEPEATTPSSAEPRVLGSLTRPSALLSFPLNFLRLPPTFPLHCHWSRQSCLSHATAASSLWHGYSSSHLQSFLAFAFLSFHLEDIVYYSPSTRWESLLTLLLPSGLSLSPRASQRFLNASFYHVYSSF